MKIKEVALVYIKLKEMFDAVYDGYLSKDEAFFCLQSLALAFLPRGYIVIRFSSFNNDFGRAMLAGKVDKEEALKIIEPLLRKKHERRRLSIKKELVLA